MLDKRMLNAEIAKNGLTKRELCKKIGMAQSTFVRKVRTGIFKTNEVEAIISVLNIKNPSEIFFAN